MRSIFFIKGQTMLVPPGFRYGARYGPGIAEAASGGGSTPLRTRSRGREEENADSTLI